MPEKPGEEPGTQLIPFVGESEENQKLLRDLQTKHFEEALVNLITRKTPTEVVRDRPGRGKLKFKFVPIAWFIQQLNALFGFNWDFEIIEHEIVNNKQIWVRGKLTVRYKDLTIVKTQYGSSEVKFPREGDKTTPIDIADDLKSAASDCLKKCATLIGLAWDVYSGAREGLERAGPDKTQLHALYKWGEKAGMTSVAAVDEWFKNQTDINPEGKAPEEVAEAITISAIVKLREMVAKKSEETKV